MPTTREVVELALRRDRGEVTSRGHDWDVADVLATIEQTIDLACYDLLRGFP